MVLKQFYLGCLAHASYVIGDTDTGTAVVVDPQRDTAQYLEYANHRGLEIRYVFLTHFHGDFVAGHLELRERACATICLGSNAQADYSFRSFRDNETLEFGKVRLRVLHTPGHSPESISILVFNLAHSGIRPHAVLTGDTLFVGDVGRPDLRGALGWPANQLARMLYRSLRDKLLILPEETLVYPAHGAGSLCGKAISKETVSTIGEQRRFNYALQPMTEDVFVSMLLADQPEAPGYFAHDVVLNTKERETLDRAVERGLQPLSLDELVWLQNAGAQVVDTRDAAAYAAAHLAGSLHIGLDGQFATWAGILLDFARPIVIVAAPGRERESITRLARVGFDSVFGYLLTGMEAVGDRTHLLEHIDRISPSELARQLGSNEPPPVIDVRTNREWREKRIAGSTNIPLNQLKDRLRELPRPALVVHCQTGYRSSAAASVLQQSAISVRDLAGGIAGWEASGLPVITGTASTA